MLLTIFLLVLFNILTTSAHYDPAYFRSSNDSFIVYNDWMKNISDNVWLSELALPGTHDSSTFNIDDIVYTTQAITFKEQLEYGIRVFDIRIRHSNDQFELFHGTMYLNLTFDRFLYDANEFLYENPSEAVIFRMSKEQNDTNDNTRTLEETFNFYLLKHPNLFKNVTENVRLGTIRGRLIMISYIKELIEYGLSMELFDIQDNYVLQSKWDLYDKWLAVRRHLKKSSQGSKLQFYKNYISGAIGVYPYFVASGHASPETSAPRLLTGLTTPPFKHLFSDFPRVNCFNRICTIAFEGTNILSRNWIQNHVCTYRTVGILMIDFPGTSLISEIIRDNHQYNSCQNKQKIHIVLNNNKNILLQINHLN